MVIWWSSQTDSRLKGCNNKDAATEQLVGPDAGLTSVANLYPVATAQRDRVKEGLAHRQMTDSPKTVFKYMPADIEWLYQTISQDARYGQYVRIPERICRCLDYFNVPSSGRAVQDRLHSYYLFIGVVDDVIDSSRLEAGREIVKQLENRTLFFNEETKQSRAKLVTEVLKCNISIEIYPMILAKLEELYQAVVRERQSKTMSVYIEQRKIIGCLTAEVSYLLIRPLLQSEHKDLRHFLRNIGEVGCLIDSVIDLRADNRLGLLGFRPTLKGYLKLLSQMLHEGLRVILRHPRLLGLFVEAIIDDLLDQLRACRAESDQLDDTKNRYAFERAA